MGKSRKWKADSGGGQIGFPLSDLRFSWSSLRPPVSSAQSNKVRMNRLAQLMQSSVLQMQPTSWLAHAHWVG